MTMMTGQDPQESRARNVRMALVLVSMAVVFFIGVIVAHSVGIGEAGLSVLGFVIFVFLAIAIGRNLLSRR